MIDTGSISELYLYFGGLSERNLKSISVAGIILLYLIGLRGLAFAQVIEFPSDHNGYVYMTKIGDIIEIWGSVEGPTPPTVDDLLDYSGPPCAGFTIVDSWDCNNPIRHGTIRLSFYYRLQVYFEGECGKDSMCFWAEGQPEYGQICIGSRFTKYAAKALVLDECGNRVKDRIQGHNRFVDMEEKIYLFAALRTDSAIAEFPHPIIGHVRTPCDSAWVMELQRQESDSIHATYRAGPYRLRAFYPECDEGPFWFSVTYGGGANYGFDGGEIEFRVTDINFTDTLPIYDSYPGSNVVCYPHNSYMTFGVEGTMDILDWPPENCQPMTVGVKAYIDGQLINIMGDTIPIEPGHFNTMPDTSTYHIQGPLYEVKNMAFFAEIDERDDRLAKPDFTPVYIFHAFTADSIIFETPPPDTIAVGDTLRSMARPVPFLKDNSRIKYSWYVNPPGAGHFRYGTGYESIYKINPFIPDSAGDCQIYYIVKDTANGYADTSNYWTIHAKLIPKLVIDKPRKDTTFWISPLPQMPEIKCRAHIAGIDTTLQRDLIFNWKVKLKYQSYILERQWSCKGIRDTFPNWGEDYGGDTVFVDVGVKYGNDSLVAHITASDNLKVLGRNIEGSRKDTVEQFIDAHEFESQAESAAKGVACYETENYYQFYETGPNVGLPYCEIGGGGGRGIMQLTYAAYVTRNSIWNWHENVQIGTQVCHSDYGSAVNNFQHDSLPGYQPTDLLLTKQILAKYNAGTQFRYYVINEVFNDFVRNISYCADCGVCGRTGEHVKTEENGYSCDDDCEHTACCYADGAYSCSH